MQAIRCATHDDRPAAGLCRRCRKPICALCSTQYDGIHHCTSCTAELVARAVPRVPPGPARVRSTLSLVVLAVATILLTWGWLELFAVGGAT